MASSKTEICNLALTHLGISKEISNVDTENSAEAQACRRWYEPARDESFRDFNWPFATKIAALGLVEETPNTDWDYSYRYPSDCMRFRRILNSIRRESRQDRIPHKIASDDTGKLIYCDVEDAVGEYTRKITDVALFSQDYVAMLSLLLASYIAPRVTAGDPYKMGDRAFKFYNISKVKAEANAFNEQNDDENPDSEFVNARTA